MHSFDNINRGFSSGVMALGKEPLYISDERSSIMESYQGGLREVDGNESRMYDKKAYQY
jgi:hypothetical protein